MRTLITYFLLLIGTSSLSALPSATVEEIAQKIWNNECKGTIEGLVSWNAGEKFLSLGIGHFIWYPAHKRGPFKETFPALIQYLQENRVTIPEWLRMSAACPWSSTPDFLESEHDPRLHELKRLLAETIPLQMRFIIKHFETTETHLTEGLPQERAKHVAKQLARMKGAPKGYYALIDYLNFKGEGTDPQEAYQGEGWGLLQVLEAMPGNTSDPTQEFADAAKDLLMRRVQNSLPENNEKRWLAGWCKRLDTYRTKI